MIKKNMRQIMLGSVCFLLACISPVNAKKAKESEKSNLEWGFMAIPTYFNGQEDANGKYKTVISRLRFNINDDYSLKPIIPDTWQTFTGADSINEMANDEYACTKDGARFDYLNTWFPYTGFFVRGAELKSVQDTKGNALALRTLSPDKEGELIADAREMEWGFSGCVGEHKVNLGHRLDQFLTFDATLTVEDESGNAHNLVFNKVYPWVLLHYKRSYLQNGHKIPVPMRPVIVTIDWPNRILSMVLQSTFSEKHKVKKIEVRVIHPDNKPAENESAERLAERSQAVIDDLSSCAMPDTPGEPCATPERVPNRLIFSSNLSDAQIAFIDKNKALVEAAAFVVEGTGIIEGCLKNYTDLSTELLPAHKTIQRWGDAISKNFTTDTAVAVLKNLKKAHSENKDTALSWDKINCEKMATAVNSGQPPESVKPYINSIND